MQRGGEVVITMLPNVQQNTIAPLITQTVSTGTVVYTDEYDIYSRPTEWGYPTTPCVTRPGSSHATRMGMDFAKSTSTRSRAFGRC